MSTNTVVSSPKAFVVNPTRTAIPEDSKAAMPKKLRPNFILEWGDGPNDQIETDDTEMLFITASNPYTNVVIQDLEIRKIKLHFKNGDVPENPDKTLTVEFIPSRKISFGDLKQKEVRREAVLMSCGAIPGKYKVEIIYDFSVCSELNDCDHFELDLFKS